MPDGGGAAAGRDSDSCWMSRLAEIGRRLDEQGDLRVLNGGVVVVPSTPAVPSSTLGTEKQNDYGKATRRSETRPRRRSPGWQGTSRGSWTSCAAAPVFGRRFEQHYQSQLIALPDYYPGPHVWHHGTDGVWVLFKSRVLDGLPVHALFVVGISYARLMVRTWGFWAHELVKPVWIGPRHTNFNDGSICAFEPSDENWQFGDPIVSLFDFYSVWAARHLHLQVFGTWPGQQIAHYAIERILEQRDSELCGCGGVKRYSECCKGKDRREVQLSDAVQFAWLSRKPPTRIFAVIRDGAAPPRLGDFET